MSKQMIDKLRRAAQVCEDWPDISNPPFHDWASLMEDAADLIENLTEDDEA